MKECWPEGSLRAYHDGELLPADMERVAAHLAECPECEALADEVAGRASRVANLMSALPAAEQVMWMPRAVPAGAAAAWPRWAAIAAVVVLAAGIAIGLAIVPRQAPPQPAAVVAVRPAAPPDVVPPPEPPPVQAATRPASRRPRPRQVFSRLDDDSVQFI